MRPALLASLVLIGLIALGLRSHYHPVPRLRVIKTTSAAEKKNPTFNVVGGWSVTDEDANQSALLEAQAALIGYLRSLDPPVEWTPSLKYIDQHLVKLKKCDTNDFKEDVGVMKQVRIDMELTSADRRNIQLKDREFHSQERMLWLAKVLGGLVASFAALAGYVHLDERTKGYYTNWLRLAAFGFVAVVGAGLWMLS
ncbi:MAG TPA: hypothetical protein VGJ87_00560 [Roseiflexaceae bacterium]|jgi:hypothetical protein